MKNINEMTSKEFNLIFNRLNETFSNNETIDFDRIKEIIDFDMDLTEQFGNLESYEILSFLNTLEGREGRTHACDYSMICEGLLLEILLYKYELNHEDCSEINEFIIYDFINELSCQIIETIEHIKED